MLWLIFFISGNFSFSFVFGYGNVANEIETNTIYQSGAEERRA